MDKGRFKKENLKISDLYPHLNDAQLKEVEENLNRYLEVILRIYERLERDQTLTASSEGTNINLKRSNPT